MPSSDIVTWATTYILYSHSAIFIFVFCYFYIAFLLFLYCISALKCLYMSFRVGYILKKKPFSSITLESQKRPHFWIVHGLIEFVYASFWDIYVFIILVLFNIFFILLTDKVEKTCPVCHVRIHFFACFDFVSKLPVRIYLEKKSMGYRLTLTFGHFVVHKDRINVGDWKKDGDRWQCIIRIICFTSGKKTGK